MTDNPMALASIPEMQEGSGIGALCSSKDWESVGQAQDNRKMDQGFGGYRNGLL